MKVPCTSHTYTEYFSKKTPHFLTEMTVIRRSEWLKSWSRRRNHENRLFPSFKFNFDRLGHLFWINIEYVNWCFSFKNIHFCKSHHNILDKKWEDFFCRSLVIFHLTITSSFTRQYNSQGWEADEVSTCNLICHLLFKAETEIAQFVTNEGSLLERPSSSMFKNRSCRMRTVTVEPWTG